MSDDEIVARYDNENRLVGLEIPGAVQRFAGQDALRQVVREGVGAFVIV